MTEVYRMSAKDLPSWVSLVYLDFHQCAFDKILITKLFAR